MRTALSRRHGWTLAVLLVAAIVTLATVRLSTSAAQVPINARSAVGHPRHAKHSPILRAPRPGHLIRTLTGTGSRAIGSIRLHRGAVLQWRTSGHPFQIYTSRGEILVTSHARRGSIGLGRGTYSSLRVSTRGAWTIRLNRRR